MNLRLLEVFAAIAETGTMSAAAQRLGVSQAAVSQSMNQLEAVLGVRLLDRAVRPPALTMVGRGVLRCATGTLETLRQLEDVIRGATAGRVPLLRIGMLDSFTSTAGAAALERLRDVADEWTVTSGFDATRLQSLLEHRVDVVVTSDDSPVPQAVHALTLATERFLLAVPARHAGPLDDMREVAASLDFIRYGRDAHMAGAIDRFLGRAGVRQAPRYQFNTTDAVMRMVAAGFGWTVVSPMILLKSMVPPGSVRLAELPGTRVARRLRVAMRRADSPQILQRFREACVRALREAVEPEVAPLLRGLPEAFVVEPETTARSRPRTGRGR